MSNENESTEQERDAYLESLHRLLRQRVKPLTAEELEHLQKNGVSQEEFLREIDRLFPARPAGA